MAIPSSLTEETLNELDTALTAELKVLELETLRRASAIRRTKVSLISLHGIIGGKNNTYVDSIRTAFPSPEVFIASWLKGLLDIIQATEADQKSKYAGNTYQNTAAHRVLQLLKDDIIYKYWETFITRNFYRQFHARTRAKPEDSHLALWFGENRMQWGLLIAPVLRNAEWVNDVSEVRRASFMYWTVGHVLATGLVDPTNNKIMSFPDTDALVQFYQAVLKRMSVSQYEQVMMDKYADYILATARPEDEPFLIPELRYAGRAANHEHRLDLTLLNSYSQEFVGFELSPQSSHMSIKGKGKTLKAHNEELTEKWDEEASKRNKYFSNRGISIITFTDARLADVDACFADIRRYLENRGGLLPSLPEQRRRMAGFGQHSAV